MQPWKRRRSYFVRGRCRVPFEGYRRARRAITSERGGRADETAYPAAHFANDLTAAQARLVQQRLTLALGRRRQQGRPCKGPWLAAMLAGIVSAVKQDRVGNSAWGRSMFGKRGGQVMARHALHHLRAIAPLGARASVIARGRRKAREAFERDRDGYLSGSSPLDS